MINDIVMLDTVTPIVQDGNKDCEDIPPSQASTATQTIQPSCTNTAQMDTDSELEPDLNNKGL